MRDVRTPLATYRLQLHSGFGFDAAAAIADYLEALGISHVYSSPYLQAMPGSIHGYDVADHHRVNLELGGAEAHDRFSLRLGACHLGQVLDIVPNHMAVGGRWNVWWWDVLENGLASPYASYFDIDWQSPEERLRNKVMLPILGDHYGRVLKGGQIRILRSGAEFTARYFDHELPIAPESMAPLLCAASAGSNGDTVGAEALAFLADSLTRLPVFESSDRETLVNRNRNKEVIRRWLERLFSERAETARAVDAQLAAINEDVDALDRLLDRQNYRLAHWKAASRDLGYRRFFDVNTLVGLHMEDEHVFADTHSLILKWLRAGVLDGVRVDHPDGLQDPREYFRRLRAAAPDVWIVAEKILEPGEDLRADWPVEGTTGYDFLNMVLGLCVDRGNEEAITAIYNEFTGITQSFEEIAHDCKIMVMRDVLGSDVNRLTALFQEICESNRDHRDYTRHDVHHAIRELVACFPIYRTYAGCGANQLTQPDIDCVERAAELAKMRRSDIDAELIDFMRDVLLLRVPGKRETDFVRQFQQFTGPAMAKGVEDTAFYRYNRMVVLNEVGGDPGRFGVSPDEFHRYCAERQKNWPRTQLAGSTHDTKRSEDVRARLAVLSEIPAEWRDAVNRWGNLNRRHNPQGPVDRNVDRNTEYLLYQTLFGAWPLSLERLQAYMLKACREAKDRTRWTAPDAPFEEALAKFVEAVHGDAEFRRDFEAFVGRFIYPGRVNSLAQTLIRMAAPGVPDIYQGTEIWNLSLVDPDNRRPVDYAERRRLLEAIESCSPEAILERMEEGLPKLWTIRQALRVRRDYPDCFGVNGAYTPVQATGEKAASVLSFRRGERVMLVVPRLVAGIATGGGNAWGDTAIEVPAGTWRNAMTGDTIQGEKIPVDRLFTRFPVALLCKQNA